MQKSRVWTLYTFVRRFVALADHSTVQYSTLSRAWCRVRCPLPSGVDPTLYCKSFDTFFFSDISIVLRTRPQGLEPWCQSLSKWVSTSRVTEATHRAVPGWNKSPRQIVIIVSVTDWRLPRASYCKTTPSHYSDRSTRPVLPQWRSASLCAWLDSFECWKIDVTGVFDRLTIAYQVGQTTSHNLPTFGVLTRDATR